MKCTECGGRTRVIDTRAYLGDTCRIRLCLKCGKKYYTREIIDPAVKLDINYAKNETARTVSGSYF
jgi:transcriptional regulator NrdR family protein